MNIPKYFFTKNKLLIRLFSSILLLVFLFITLIFDFYQKKKIYLNSPEGSFHLVKVIDGDTILVRENFKPNLLDTIINRDAKEEITVRLLGINTPETVDPKKKKECFGPEASQYLKNIISENILLYSDPQKPDKDNFDRLLRYVFNVKQDNINKIEKDFSKQELYTIYNNKDYQLFINYQILKNGYAYQADYGEKYLFINDFKEIEKKAKQQSLGLWSKETCNGQKNYINK